MPDRLIILGLYTADTDPSAFPADVPVWTLNDWYMAYPELKHPSRVYNVHKNFPGHATDTRRFANWLAEYNRSGAEIVARSPLPGIQKLRLFDDIRGRREFGALFFSCSICYMIADAIWENVKTIDLLGLRLADDGEYRYQAPGVCYAIDVARRLGVTVNAPWEHIWREQPIAIDWSALDPELSLMYGDPGFSDKVPVRVRPCPSVSVRVSPCPSASVRVSDLKNQGEK